MQISDYAHLEFGFRLQSTQESYRKLEQLLGKDQKVEWARTEVRPSRSKFFAIPADATDSGRIEVPAEVEEIFDHFAGFLMLKLVGPLPAGHYANLAMYHKLWDFDKTSPQRENGDWVYSAPIHGLKPPIENQREDHKFLFVIRIDGDRNSATLHIDRINITRGVRHFTARRKSFDPVTASPENLAGVASRVEIRQGKETFRPFQDLPLQAAVDRFLARL